MQVILYLQNVRDIGGAIDKPFESGDLLIQQLKILR